MLEGIIATVLSRYLGDYIEGLERENLSLGISSGHVKLENLRLKKEALADLELPLEIKEGVLGSLALEIPWSEIYSKPSIARIDRLFVVCGPSKPSEYDPALVARKTLETKKRQLQLAELLASEAGRAANRIEPLYHLHLSLSLSTINNQRNVLTMLAGLGT
jgi:hypothetical protein